MARLQNSNLIVFQLKNLQSFENQQRSLFSISDAVRINKDFVINNCEVIKSGPNTRPVVQPTLVLQSLHVSKQNYTEVKNKLKSLLVIMCFMIYMIQFCNICFQPESPPLIPKLPSKIAPLPQQLVQGLSAAQKLQLELIQKA